ncbi:MAG: lipase [Mycobacteriaceae bacterium]|nr:lipase [Mycobacteriaceae bacterium]
MRRFARLTFTAALAVFATATLTVVQAGPLRAQQAPGPLVSVRPLAVPLPARAWQVRYSSTDDAGAPVTGTATVLIPPVPWFGPGPRPLVSQQVAQDSLGAGCGSSDLLARGELLAVNPLTLELPVITAMLLHNWAVILPDHQGPQGTFGDRALSAHLVLDGLRAAQHLPDGEFSGDTPMAASGYSGGALATWWAAEEQAAYAPELRMAGIVAGGTPAGLLDLVAKLDGGPRAALGPLVLLSQVRAHPELAPLLNEHGRAELARAGASCALDLTDRYRNTRLDQLTAVPHVWTDPQLRSLVDRLEPGLRVPAVPLLEFHSTADDVIPIAHAGTLAARYCAGGAIMQRLNTPVPLHDLTPLAAMPGYLSWLSDRFAGRPAPSTC